MCVCVTCTAYYYMLPLYPGTRDAGRLSDKQPNYIHKMGVRTDQLCLYNTSPDSVLYQEMLSFKASQVTSSSVVAERELNEDDSDWEIVPGGRHYRGGSGSSDYMSPVFYSDENLHSHSPYVLDASKRSMLSDSTDSDEDSDIFLDGRIRIRGDVDLQRSDDEIEVGFLRRRGNANPPRSGVMGEQPTQSSEGVARSTGSRLRKGRRKVVVHPTLHLREEDTPTKSGVEDHRPHPGIRHHPHSHRSKEQSRKQPEVDISGADASPPTHSSTKTTSPSLATQQRMARDKNKSSPHTFNANTSRISTISCPTDLLLSPRSTSDSPDSGTMGYFTPRHIDEDVDIIPPSTSEEEEDDLHAHALNSKEFQKKRPLQRYNFDTPLLHIPPLSGSSSSSELNTPASTLKKSSSANNIKEKAKEEDVDSPFAAGRTLGLPTTAGLTQTSR